MTRTAFLAALEQLLAPLPEAERKDALVIMKIIWMPPGRKTKPAPLQSWAARRMSPAKFWTSKARKAPLPPRHPLPASRIPAGAWYWAAGWRCWCWFFFFQHSKATPVQPVEPVSSSSEIPASSAEVPAESSSTQPAAPVSTSDGLTFSLSAEMVSDELSLKLDYGTVLFVVDPNASDITLQFDGFRTRYLIHSNKKTEPQSFPTMSRNTTLSLILTVLYSPLQFRKISCIR